MTAGTSGKMADIYWRVLVSKYQTNRIVCNGLPYQEGSTPKADTINDFCRVVGVKLIHNSVRYLELWWNGG